jgi:uncharacterized membrane protein
MHNLFGFSTPLVVLLAIIIGVLFVGLLGSGLARLGLSWWQASLVLLASLVGSAVNIPLGVVRSQTPAFVVRTTRYHGFHVPVHSIGSQSTIVAINVGGALIPVAICLFLLLRFPKSVPIALMATVAVAIIVHIFAQPVAGVGIETPALLPPFVAAGATLILSAVFAGGAQDRFVSAYISGTLGTLIGADLMNLGLLGSLGGGAASIGGAGTFDGVFLTGLLAVVLLFEPFTSRSPENPDSTQYPDDSGPTLAFSH